MSTKTRVVPINWNLAGVWNEAAIKEEHSIKPRDYIYASEIGMPFVDRWLKMKGTAYTNPPNSRSRRKFLAGNIWEYVTKQILVACGVFRHEEIKIDAQPYSGMLDVHGRCDFIAGGYVDADVAAQRIHALGLPDFLLTVAEKIAVELDGKYLAEKILELKAVSTFAMDKVERSDSAIPNHTMQGYHYQKNSEGKIQAAISYICKDDCRMAQYDVDQKIAEPLYRADIEQMTEHFKSKKRPPNAPLASFDETTGKFSKNLGVEYSPYLSLLYGFETPDAYRESVKFLTSWNRTLDRLFMAETGKTTPTGKPISITPKNKEVLDEIKANGYNLDDLLKCKMELGVSDEDDSE